MRKYRSRLALGRAIDRCLHEGMTGLEVEQFVTGIVMMRAKEKAKAWLEAGVVTGIGVTEKGVS